MPRLNSAADLDALRKEILSKRAPDRPGISVCAGTGCQDPANGRLIQAFEAEIEKQGLQDKLDLRATGCHGYCQKGPIAICYPDERCHLEVKPKDVPGIVSGSSTGQKLKEIPFYQKQRRLLMGSNPKVSPDSIEDYLAAGGYAGLSKALFEMSPDEVVQEVKKANLRGRGGGGFPAGRKWETARNAPGDEKYVIVNGHEGELGAFMDRALFGGNPHLVLEGLIIGGYAIGSRQGYIYTRHDNPRLLGLIEGALSAARRHGLLGDNILGSDFCFDVEVHLDVGIFVSGESSALMRSLEGKNPEPRAKYIRTSVKGVRDKPTNLNNVETWSNVPQIIKNGADWYLGIGTEKSSGTKMVSLSGNITNTGVAEVPFGTTLKEIVYDIGGGIPNGKKLKAVHFGGPMGGSVPAGLIDTPLDFDECSKLGAAIGAGSMLILDEDQSMVETTRFFLDFLSRESCGKCVPCREGIRQMLKVVTRIGRGEGRKGDIELLEELSEVAGTASLCALGKTASDPLLSTLRYFKNDFEANIR